MIEFEYNGKRYYTENLDKKLKRFKIKSRDQIKIITENSTHGQKKQEDPSGNELNNYPRIYIWNDVDNTIYNKHWNPNISPTMENLLKYENFLWDESTKTGTDNRFNKEWCDSHLHILKGKPIFPLSIINGEVQIMNDCTEWICF